MDAFDCGIAVLFVYLCITLPMVLRSVVQALAHCKPLQIWPLQIQELRLTPRLPSLRGALLGGLGFGVALVSPPVLLVTFWGVVPYKRKRGPCVLCCFSIGFGSNPFPGPCGPSFVSHITFRVQGSKIPLLKHCDIQETAVMQYNMVPTTQRVEATLFIVEDATVLPERAHWAAVLTGGWVAEASSLQKRTGVVLKLKRAIRTQKKIFLTDDFKARHPEIAGLIQDSIQHLRPKNGWRITSEMPKANFVLCSSQNLVDPASQGQKVFLKDQFISHIEKLDMDKSGKGRGED